MGPEIFKRFIEEYERDFTDTSKHEPVPEDFDIEHELGYLSELFKLKKEE